MSKKGLIILVICFLVVAMAVGAGLFLFWGKVSGIGSETVEGNGKVLERKEAKLMVKALLSLETFVVNLADPGGKRYLRVSMALEIDDKDFVEEAKKNIPQMRDKILMILPAKKFSDIRTSSGEKRFEGRNSRGIESAFREV